MLKSEVSFYQSIKAHTLSKRVIKLDCFECLEEHYKNLGKHFWIIPIHYNMILSLQTPHIALNQEVEREGEIFKVIDSVGDHGNFLDRQVFASFMVLNNLNGVLYVSQGIIFV